MSESAIEIVFCFLFLPDASNFVPTKPVFLVFIGNFAPDLVKHYFFW